MSKDDAIQDRVAVAISIDDIYITPNGIPHKMSRIGELRNGICISTPIMSDREIDEAGLPAWVKRGDLDANRLYVS